MLAPLRIANHLEFQFLIGIINHAPLRGVLGSRDMFQFLIGIINQRTCRNSIDIFVRVSIPHRYYKSIKNLPAIIETGVFQFLIGIINRADTVKKYADEA